MGWREEQVFGGGQLANQPAIAIKGSGQLRALVQSSMRVNSEAADDGRGLCLEEECAVTHRCWW